jgi:hypothetical protein
MIVIWEEKDGKLPKKCIECPFGYMGDLKGVCNAMSKTGSRPITIKREVYFSARPDWCPLVTGAELLKQVASPFSKWEENDE